MNTNICILYTDDEPINLYVFERIFSRKFKVVVANSGLEGLEMIKNNPEITLIITDMQMPHLDGIQFIRKAKEIKPNMPCYILTGYEITPEISDAIKEGLIVEYFKKPLEEDLLERAVHKLNK